MRRLILIGLSLHLAILSSCVVKKTETRGKINTQNLVSFEEVRENPDKYIGKEISFRFKAMLPQNFANQNDTDCCALTLLPIDYLGTSQLSLDNFLKTLDRIENHNFSIVNEDFVKKHKTIYEDQKHWLNDIKKTNPKSVLNDIGTWDAYFNCPVPAELYNKGFDYLSTLKIVSKTEVQGEFYPKLSNTYTDGIATGILYNVHTPTMTDSTQIAKINKIIGRSIYSTGLDVYITGIQFKKNFF